MNIQCPGNPVLRIQGSICEKIYFGGPFAGMSRDDALRRGASGIK
jgi:hypothetical protein